MAIWSVVLDLLSLQSKQKVVLRQIMPSFHLSNFSQGEVSLSIKISLKHYFGLTYLTMNNNLNL